MSSRTTLLAQLEAGTLPAGGFHHADHVRAAWECLRSGSLLEAIERFSRALRAYAAAKGKPERYHETVTWAYLLIMHDRMARRPGASWEDFSAHNRDLFEAGNEVLLDYYRQETLQSELARRVFLMPDRSSRRRGKARLPGR